MQVHVQHFTISILFSIVVIPHPERSIVIIVIHRPQISKYQQKKGFNPSKLNQMGQKRLNQLNSLSTFYKQID